MIGKTTFRDDVGRLWKVEINAESIERARWIGVDLNAQGTAAYLSANPVVALNVVYYIVKAQADARGVTLDDFTKASASAPKAIACLVEAMKNIATPK